VKYDQTCVVFSSVYVFIMLLLCEQYHLQKTFNTTVYYIELSQIQHVFRLHMSKHLHLAYKFIY
jgi:uncharacterized membrane protein YqjE